MRVLTTVKGNAADFLQEAGQEFIRPFSVVFGRSYCVKDNISEEHTSTINKVIIAFVATLILPLTLLFSTIGVVMVSFSSSHKKAYKQIQEEYHNKEKTHIAPSSSASPSSIKNVSSAKTSEIELFIKEKGLLEKIALNARYHLSPFNTACAYPRRLGCGTPFVNEDREMLHSQSRKILFDELSINLQNSLNDLEISEKNSILDQVIHNQITEHNGIVHQMEEDLFNFLKKSDLFGTFKFDNQELNFDTLSEIIKDNLRKCLIKPLSERLNQFGLPMQNNLLLSAYCQLKKIKTGTGDVIKV